MRRLYHLFLVAVALLVVGSARAADTIRLSNIIYTDGVVKIQLNAPTNYSTSWWKSQKRFVVDIDAKGIDLGIRQLPVFTSRLKSVRWNQFQPGTVRVVLDLGDDDRPTVLSSPGTDDIEVRVAPPEKDAAPQKPPVTSVAHIENATPTPPSSRPSVQDIRIERGDDERPTRVVILTDKPIPAKAGWWGNHLFLDFPDADSGLGERVFPVNDSDLVRVRPGRFDGHARVTLDFNRHVNYKLSSLDTETGVALDISYPAPDPAAPAEPEPTVVDQPARSIKDMTIVIDPGHGDFDTGAKGPWILEKDATLDMGLRLRKLLEAAGAHVIMTRDTDIFIPLHDRPAVAMNHGAAAFISIHCNSSRRPNNHGTEAYYRRDNAESRRLAMCLYDAHRKATNLTGRGVKPDSGAPQGGLAVLKHTTVPCCLIEVGFINAPDEGKKIADPKWRETVAEALARGVQNFAGGGQ